MPLVSFPRADESPKEPTLYDKVFHVASTVFSSLRQDQPPTTEGLAPVTTSTPPNATTIEQHRAPRSPITTPTPIELPSPPSPNAIANNSSTSELPVPQSTSSPAFPGTKETSVPPMPPPPPPHLDHPVSRGPSSPAPPSTSRVDAVPVLPTLTAASTPLNYSRAPTADAESTFSIGSYSASRAYLASQYSRSRSRAQPSRLNKEYWMKDENAKVCYNCSRRFTTFRRKHHCRVCGQIFCSACTVLVEGEWSGTRERRVRCCKSCEDALNLHSSSDDEADASFFSQAFDPDMSGLRSTSSVRSVRSASVSSSSTQSSASTQGSSSSENSTSTRRSRESGSPDSSTAADNEYTDQDQRFATAEPEEPSVARSFLGSQSMRNRSSSRDGGARFPNSSTVELNNAAREYLLLFLEQLLRDSELDPSEWRAVLTRPLLEVAAGLHLELSHRLSPREWVKIKRIEGGSPEDISCICGTVFTHELARRSMPHRIKTPRILLIAFPLEYARLERYVSLDPVAAQEKEYLKKLVARVVALRPSIVLSCASVCGKAMDMLEQKGIAVAQHVQENALFRLSRLTNADILVSVDRLSAAPKLGSCEFFEQRAYRNNNLVKQFLFFYVRPGDPGRCALVRGDAEISSVIKVVLEVMAEICYSLKAETALMRDQLVNVPNFTEKEPLILSSSPFVNYGRPFLQTQMHLLEDKVVMLGEKCEQSESPEERYILQTQLDLTRTRWLHAARLWEGIESIYPFMFNPSSHQNLLVLYSLVCNDTATPCVGPEQQLIEFYLSTDQTLGQFVETTISQVDLKCPDGCGRNMQCHSKRYINGKGMVTISLKEMPCNVSGLEDCILMWSYCRLCAQNMPIAPMSSTTWKYSMGKYLELSWYAEPLKMRASTCTHNIYRDHIRYFGWHGYALSFEYAEIQLHEIRGPPPMLAYDPEAEVRMKREAFENLKSRLDKFWQSILDSLANVKVEGLEQEMIELSQERLAELKAKAKADWNACVQQLNTLREESAPNDYLSLNKVIMTYQQLVDKWHADLADFDGQFFPTERDIRRVTALHIRGLLGEFGDKKVENAGSDNESEGAEDGEGDGGKEGEEEEGEGKVEDKQESNPPTTPKKKANSLVLKDATPTPSETPIEKPSPALSVKSRFGNKINLSIPEFIEPAADERRAVVNEFGKVGRVSFLAKHFEELSREFEYERQREKQRLKDRQRSIMINHANTVAEVFEDLTDEVEDWPQHPVKPKLEAPSQHEIADAPTQTPADAPVSAPSETPLETPAADNLEPAEGSAANIVSLTPQRSQEDEEAKKTEPVKTSLIRSLANFWSERSSTRWNGLEYMLSITEHYFANSNVVLRESEPSSLIAFCLSLPDYCSRINEFYKNTPGVGSGESKGDAAMEQAMLRRTGTHMRYYFDRNTVKASCKIFFSEQFDALRRKCQVSDKYIQSLSRCTTWDSLGGKSGSAFLKTLDDRLILKELSHAEFDSFITFAPSYFEYMAQALFHDLPTVLCKLFGVYQIIIKSTQKSQPIKMYVIVMENLFYGRKFDKFFDLKGSMRNRKVTETGKANEVLLDENMVEYIYDTPVFVREHSKRMLRASLYNDTLFLTKMNVMDYSLVIGLDDENNTIVAGIIDYIRTYTWDKKVESWVKARAATSNIKEPTVISPKQYKGRFRESMERYFVMVPDCWSQPAN